MVCLALLRALRCLVDREQPCRIDGDPAVRLLWIERDGGLRVIRKESRGLSYDSKVSGQFGEYLIGFATLVPIRN